MTTPRSQPLCGGDAPKRHSALVHGTSSGTLLHWLRSGCVLAASVLMAATPFAASADFVDDLNAGATAKPSPQPSAKETPNRSGSTEGTRTQPESTQAGSPGVPASPPTPAAAGQKPEPRGLLSEDVTKHDTAAPIDFKGRIMKGQRSLGRVDLEGDVVITQADARMLSDTATLLSDPGSQQTRKAIARGKVRFSKQPTPAAPPLKAEADEMEYFVPERRILMTGKPKVWRGSELIQGKEILLELDTGEVTIKEARGIVEPGKAAPKQGTKK